LRVPYGTTDEGQVALDRHRRDGRHGAVAPRSAERVGIRVPRELGGVLALPQHVRFDAAFAGGLGQLFGRWALGPGARVDEQESAHREAAYWAARPES